MSSQDRRFQVRGRPARVLHRPQVLQYIAHARARPRGLRAFKLSRSGISRYSNQANGRQGRPPAIAPCARGGDSRDRPIVPSIAQIRDLQDSLHLMENVGAERGVRARLDAL